MIKKYVEPTSTYDEVRKDAERYRWGIVTNHDSIHTGHSSHSMRNTARVSNTHAGRNTQIHMVLDRGGIVQADR